MIASIFLFKITYLCLNLIFFVKKFSKVLLIITFTLFIVGSVQSISADHLENEGKGIFTSQNDANLVSDKDSKYKIHFQVVARDTQGQLISVLESSGGEYLQHELTDAILRFIVSSLTEKNDALFTIILLISISELFKDIFLIY